MTPDATPTPLPTPSVIAEGSLLKFEGYSTNLQFASAGKPILQIDGSGRVTISPHITLDDLATVIQTLKDQCKYEGVTK